MPEGARTLAPNGTTASAREARPPWSPLSVAIIAFLLPAGGAMLTIRNLQRLGQLDQRAARELIAVVLLVCAVGYALLISYATKNANGFLQPDAGASAVLPFGFGLACFSAQRRPFRQWRSVNPSTRTSSWTGGIGVALVYMLLTLVVVLPIYAAAQLLGIGHQALQ